MKLQKKCGLMVLLLLTVLFQTPESYSTNAYVTVTYYNQSSNHSTTEVCECGIYGLASPVANAGGTVGIPKSFNYQACDPHTEFTYSETPWIALIERGNCTFSEKIQTANRRGAEAAVIYNVPESGNETLQMANFDPFFIPMPREASIPCNKEVKEKTAAPLTGPASRASVEGHFFPGEGGGPGRVLGWPSGAGRGRGGGARGAGPGLPLPPPASPPGGGGVRRPGPGARSAAVAAAVAVEVAAAAAAAAAATGGSGCGSESGAWGAGGRGSGRRRDPAPPPPVARPPLSAGSGSPGPGSRAGRARRTHALWRRGTHAGGQPGSSAAAGSLAAGSQTGSRASARAMPRPLRARARPGPAAQPRHSRRLGPPGALWALAIALALGPPPPASRGAEAAAVWTAYLNVSWRARAPGLNSTGWELSEEGVYGQDSPLEPAAGLVLPPDGPGALNACSPHTNFSVPAAGVPWLALIQRGGGCTFADKINLAFDRGATGAVIYNFAGTRNDVFPMSHPGAGDIVSIMIGNLKGTKILQSIQRGIQVTMVIEVGKKHGPWMNHYSIFFVSVSFFIVTAATVGYFIFYSARRLRNARAQNRKQRQLKADAKRAIGKLQLRALKHGDKETGPDGDSCAVCIEIFRPNDIVRILTCNHLFHKTCIDPWLLEHRTCPMCKCDILKALGVEADVEAGTVSFQTAGSNPNINGSPDSYSPHEEDSHSETASSGYASVQGADEPPMEERAQSQNDHLRLVNHDASSVAVDVLPQLDNPAFEADEPSVREASIHQIKF